jgi:phosphotransferase system HPr (HPr) family protein
MTQATAEFVVHNASGLHARPAARFVEQAKAFESTVTVRRDGASANGKSLVSLLRLGINSGACLTVDAEGADAQAAVDALVGLLGVLDAKTETH